MRTETPQQFTDRVRKLEGRANALSIQLCDGYAERNRWMCVAKTRGMTWVEGLDFAIDRMQGRDESS